MLIVRITPDINGQREGLQSWSGETPPENYVEFPAELRGVFYPSDKIATGFVTFDVVDNGATNVLWNETAYQAYINNLPDPMPEPEPMTQSEIEEMLLDQEYRILLLEYGLEDEIL